MKSIVALFAALLAISPAMADSDIVTIGAPASKPAVPSANVTAPRTFPAATTMPSGLDAGAAALDAVRSSGGYRGPNLTYEDVLAAIARPVRLYDLNGDGLSRDELDIPDKMQAAQFRAQAAQRFLPADLNNDKQVTRAEYDLVSRASPQFQRQPNAFEQADANGDGVLNWDEMTSTPNAAAAFQQAQSKRMAAMTLNIDPTPGTNFTLADAKAAADKIFADYDTNKGRHHRSG